jgi:hypothetical protein
MADVLVFGPPVCDISPMKIVLLTIGLLAIGIVGMASKILLKKDGKFPGTCASNSPYLNKEGEACAYCGASPDGVCKKKKLREAQA